jgi:hypothetical protein
MAIALTRPRAILIVPLNPIGEIFNIASEFQQVNPMLPYSYKSEWRKLSDSKRKEDG